MVIKRIFLLLIAVTLLASMILPGAALAGGKNGQANGNSGNSNDFCVIHNGEELWLPNANALQAHLNHGDKGGKDHQKGGRGCDDRKRPDKPETK